MAQSNDLADYVALQQQAAAEAGTGTLTAQQEADLNREQNGVFNKVTGKQCLFLLQLAAQQRVHILGEPASIPSNVRFYPHTLISGFRAIEFITDQQYMAMVKVLNEAAMGPVDPLEIKRLDPAHVLDKDTVYDLYMKAFSQVTANSMLPPVPAQPAATVYQRSLRIALTINLKAKLSDLLSHKKNNQELAQQLRTEFKGYAPASSSGASSSSNNNSPYMGPNPKKNGGPGKGGQNNNPGKGGGKGKKGGGAQSGGAVDTCLDWIEGNCSGRGRSTCPKGHRHAGSLQKITWLNSRFLEGRVSDDQCMAKSREADNS